MTLTVSIVYNMLWSFIELFVSVGVLFEKHDLTQTSVHAHGQVKDNESSTVVLFARIVFGKLPFWLLFDIFCDLIILVSCFGTQKRQHKCYMHCMFACVIEYKYKTMHSEFIYIKHEALYRSYLKKKKKILLLPKHKNPKELTVIMFA